MIVDRKTNSIRHGRRALCLTMCLAAGLPGAARAQGPVLMAANERDTSADNEMLLAGDIIVTASKTAQHISDSPAAATVITADQIERSGATTIVELLRSVPGVDVMEPNKTQANVAIRGFNDIFANKVLMMVDGRSINDDLHGNVYWNTEPLLLSRIARIEIVRGPGSVLYGADAFGGVINIITKTPLKLLAERKRTSFTAAKGDFSSTFVEAANTQGKAGDWAVTAGGGYHGSSGFGERQPGHIRDSYSTPILTLDAQKQLARGVLSFSANHSDATADLSVQFGFNDAKWRTNSVTLTYDENKGPTPITARVYRTSLHSDKDPDHLTSDVVNFDLQQSRRVSDRHHLLYGGGMRHGEYKTTKTGQESHSQNISSLFVQDQIQIDAATNLFAGVRWDRNSTYAPQISPRLSLVRHLPKEQTARLSYGTAFRAPSQVDNYLDSFIPLAPGLAIHTVGDTNLKPEKVSSIEAGYRKELTGGYLGLNLFYNTITDTIGIGLSDFAPPPFPPGIPTVIKFVNQGGARAAGFELESGFSLARGVHGLLNYAYQDATAQNGDQIDYSPNHKVNLVLNMDERRRITSYLAAHFVSAAREAPATIRAYTTVDANVGYRVGGSENPWTLSLAATNLLDDRHYEYVDVLNPISASKYAEAQRRTLWVRLDGKF